MEFNNTLSKLSANGGVDKETLRTFARLLAPFAPHIAEEIYEILGGEGSVFASGWPEADAAALVVNTREIAVQINGKMRATIKIDVNADKDTVIAAAKEAAGKWLTDNIVKEIYVPGKIVNIVCK